MAKNRPHDPVSNDNAPGRRDGRGAGERGVKPLVGDTACGTERVAAGGQCRALLVRDGRGAGCRRGGRVAL